jgi:NTP pyrophosphatase (non-canonical NTP hydrolase)
MDLKVAEMDVGEQLAAALDELAEAFNEESIRKGFVDPEKPRSVEAISALLHSEVSELFEAYRDGKLNHPTKKMIEMDGGMMTNLEEELADIIIRALQNSLELGVPSIGRAVLAKFRHNQSRPAMHGGKKL